MRYCSAAACPHLCVCSPPLSSVSAHRTPTQGVRDPLSSPHLPVPQVPDMFQRPAVQALVEYVYSDQLAKGLEPDKVLDVLHVASYYGAGR